MSHSSSTDAHTVQAYDNWARSYPPTAHNPLMLAEQRAMLALWPNAEGSCALDLACGTGRYAQYLRDSGAALVVGVDLSTAMLSRLNGPHRVRASMTQLPFAANVFSVAVCALALGHAPDVRQWMGEIARVLAPGGVLLYSDFHPEAARAGLTRSFTDDRQRKWTLSHYSHSLAQQSDAANRVGLGLDVLKELRVGIEVKEPFAGSETFYRRWHGLPLVLVVRASKVAA